MDRFNMDYEDVLASTGGDGLVHVANTSSGAMLLTHELPAISGSQVTSPQILWMETGKLAVATNYPVSGVSVLQLSKSSQYAEALPNSYDSTTLCLPVCDMHGPDRAKGEQVIFSSQDKTAIDSLATNPSSPLVAVACRESSCICHGNKRPTNGMASGPSGQRQYCQRKELESCCAFFFQHCCPGV